MLFDRRVTWPDIYYLKLSTYNHLLWLLRSLLSYITRKTSQKMDIYSLKNFTDQKVTLIRLRYAISHIFRSNSHTNEAIKFLLLGLSSWNKLCKIANSLSFPVMYNSGGKKWRHDCLFCRWGLSYLIERKLIQILLWISCHIYIIYLGTCVCNFYLIDQLLPFRVSDFVRQLHMILMKVFL